MSYVSTVYLQFSSAECVSMPDGHRFLEINTWLASQFYAPMKDLQPHFGGTKGAEISAMGGAYSRPIYGFEEFLSGLEWEDPDDVVLIASQDNGGGGKTVSIWRLGDKELWPLHAPPE